MLEIPVRRKKSAAVTRTPESVLSGSGVLCRSGKGLLSRKDAASSLLRLSAPLFCLFCFSPALYVRFSEMGFLYGRTSMIPETMPIQQLNL